MEPCLLSLVHAPPHFTLSAHPTPFNRFGIQDHLRAGHSKVEAALAPDVAFEQRLKELQVAEQHYKDAAINVRNPQPNAGQMERTAKEVDLLLLKIEWQLVVMKTLRQHVVDSAAAAKRRPDPAELERLSTLNLFANEQSQQRVICVELLWRGNDVEANFSQVFKMIQVFKLEAAPIYEAACVRLAEEHQV